MCVPHFHSQKILRCMEEKANVDIIICCPLWTSGLATLSNVFFNTSYCIAQGKVCPSVGRLLPISYNAWVQHWSRIKTEKKAKVVAVGWGMYLIAALLAARMTWTKVLGEHPFWWGGDLVWCEPDGHPFVKASIPPSSRYSTHPLFQIILVENC